MPTHADRIHAALLAELHPSGPNAAPASARPPLPRELPFPPDLLPEPLATWAAVASTSADLPLPFVVLPFLAATGALLGSRLSLQLHPHWHEVASLWVALVAPPGCGKSIALTQALAPFAAFHIETAASDLDSLLAGVPLPPDGPPDPDPASVDALAFLLGNLDLPGGASTHLLSSHRRVSQVQHHLDQANGLVLVHDNLTSSLGRMPDVDLSQLRATWESANLDFTARTANHHRRPGVVAVVGGLQPHRLASLARAGCDGMLSSLIPVFPASRVASWPQAGPGYPPEATPQAIASWLTPLAGWSNPPGQDNQVVVRLTPPAAERWVTWYNHTMAHASTTTAAIAAFERKLPVQAARLALILHALWHRDRLDTPLTLQTLSRALALVACIQVHVHRVAWVLGHTVLPETPVHKLCRRITATLGDEWITRTQLAIALGRPATACLSAALDALAHDRLIQVQTASSSGPSGGRRPTSYRLAMTG